MARKVECQGRGTLKEPTTCVTNISLESKHIYIPNPLFAALNSLAYFKENSDGSILKICLFDTESFRNIFMELLCSLYDDTLPLDKTRTRETLYVNILYKSINPEYRWRHNSNIYARIEVWAVIHNVL